MKITLRLIASDTSRREVVDVYDDMGISEEDWNALSDSQKNKYLDEFAENLPEQPYWITEYFTENQ